LYFQNLIFQALIKWGGDSIGRKNIVSLLLEKRATPIKLENGIFLFSSFSNNRNGGCKYEILVFMRHFFNIMRYEHNRVFRLGNDDTNQENGTVKITPNRSVLGASKMSLYNIWK
jgi:hypothetical protein